VLSATSGKPPKTRLDFGLTCAWVGEPTTLGNPGAVLRNAPADGPPIGSATMKGWVFTSVSGERSWQNNDGYEDVLGSLHTLSMFRSPAENIGGAAAVISLARQPSGALVYQCVPSGDLRHR
jgi:hypothetical protein